MREVAGSTPDLDFYLLCEHIYVSFRFYHIPYMHWSIRQTHTFAKKYVQTLPKSRRLCLRNSFVWKWSLRHLLIILGWAFLSAQRGAKPPRGELLCQHVHFWQAIGEQFKVCIKCRVHIGSEILTNPQKGASQEFSLWDWNGSFRIAHHI
jgi:hypothetical protein